MLKNLEEPICHEPHSQMAWKSGLDDVKKHHCSHTHTNTSDYPGVPCRNGEENNKNTHMQGAFPAYNATRRTSKVVWESSYVASLEHNYRQAIRPCKKRENGREKEQYKACVRVLCCLILLGIITYLSWNSICVEGGKKRTFKVFFQLVAKLLNKQLDTQMSLLTLLLAILPSPSWRAFACTTTLQLIGSWLGRREHNGGCFHACLLHHSPSGHFHQNPRTYFSTKENGPFREPARTKSRVVSAAGLALASHISIPMVVLLPNTAVATVTRKAHGSSSCRPRCSLVRENWSHSMDKGSHYLISSASQVSKIGLAAVLIYWGGQHKWQE